MRFYDTYQQKINTWCFLILAATIIRTFFFRDWDEPKKNMHDHLTQRTMALAVMDQPKPADTTVANIRKLLIKFSDTYQMPVDSIADKVAAFHEAFDSQEPEITGLIPQPQPKTITNLELLQMIDKLEYKKLPNVPDSFKVRMTLAITAVILKRVNS